ncbi:MAG TPA: alpha/beta fold hydrolase [Solirubrobacteraceae bacterium]|jgi:pimeloyl-ACP methyl ester carboxylesterase|nr:alpha/beta fold hydrolase [Solirubrobacteraceae bacterium]
MELAVETHGEGPAVVGLHGLTATRRYVLMGSRLLERSGRRVILYDARGHGESPAAPAGDYGYEALAGDLATVMDAQRAPRALLVGASMGAHTALRLALEEPQRAEGLVIVTPGYDPARGGSDFEYWDSLAAALRDGGVEGFVAAYGLERLPERWRATIETVLRQRIAAHRDQLALADALSAVPRSRPFEDFGELAQVAVPTLVVGSRDEADPGHPLALARRYADAIPGASFVVEEEGRSPIAWQGGQLSRLLLDFH